MAEPITYSPYQQSLINLITQRTQGDLRSKFQKQQKSTVDAKKALIKAFEKMQEEIVRKAKKAEREGGLFAKAFGDNLLTKGLDKLSEGIFKEPLLRALVIGNPIAAAATEGLLGFTEKKAYSKRMKSVEKETKKMMKKLGLEHTFIRKPAKDLLSAVKKAADVSEGDMLRTAAAQALGAYGTGRLLGGESILKGVAPNLTTAGSESIGKGRGFKPVKRLARLGEGVLDSSKLVGQNLLSAFRPGNIKSRYMHGTDVEKALMGVGFAGPDTLITEIREGDSEEPKEDLEEVTYDDFYPYKPL